MSDLISREEVLNLIDTAFENGAFDGRYAYENLIDAVQNLIHPLETDLISRKAAIDAIWKPIIKPNEMIFDALKQAQQNEIETLPSVEPERNFIEKVFETLREMDDAVDVICNLDVDAVLDRMDVEETR